MRHSSKEKWTAQEEAILRRMWQELYARGVPIKTRSLMILRHLPGRSKNAVTDKAKYMRLPQRCPRPGGSK